MRPFAVSYHRPARCLWLVAGFLLLAATASFSQPEDFERPVDPAVEAVERKAFTELQTRLKEVEKQDPGQAIAQYQKFVNDHPHLNAPIDILAGVTLAHLHYNGRKDARAALEICERTLHKHPAHPNRYSMLVAEGEILVADGQAAAAEKLLQDTWQQGQVECGPWQVTAIMQPYTAALERQGKTEAEIKALGQALIESPALLNSGDRSQSSGASAWIYQKLVDTLIREARYDEALGWSKLRFMECTFDEAAIKGAGDMLAKVLTGKTGNPAAAQAFLESQQGDKAGGPLVQVALPELDDFQQKTHLAALQQGNLVPPNRISLHILLGSWREAILEAHRQLVEHPEDPNAVQEVARIFKAHDLTIKRANAWLEFYRTGEGANPMVEFLKETMTVKRTAE